LSQLNAQVKKIVQGAGVLLKDDVPIRDLPECNGNKMRELATGVARYGEFSQHHERLRISVEVKIKSLQLPPKVQSRWT
jgi:hypothetical protein